MLITLILFFGNNFSPGNLAYILKIVNILNIFNELGTMRWKWRKRKNLKHANFCHNIFLSCGWFANLLVKEKQIMHASSLQKQPPECSVRKGVLRNFIKFRNEVCNFIKIVTLVQVFSCEFYEISKNTFFTEQLRATASVCNQKSGTVCSVNRNCLYVQELAHFIINCWQVWKTLHWVFACC